MKKLISLALIFVIISALCACEKEAERTDTCYLEITAAEAVAFDGLSSEKRELLPEDGVILEKCEVKFSEGENAYDVVLRTLRENKIHYDADTASKYFKAIGNLYPEDCGEYAGWLYYINGDMPSVGMADYILSDGDTISFAYTTDFTKE